MDLEAVVETYLEQSYEKDDIMTEFKDTGKNNMNVSASKNDVLNTIQYI